MQGATDLENTGEEYWKRRGGAPHAAHAGADVRTEPASLGTTPAGDPQAPTARTLGADQLPSPEVLQAIASEVALSKSKNVPDPLPWEKVLTVVNQYTNPAARFDAMWFYLYGQRVGEAVSRTQAKDVQIRTLNGREFLVLESVTEKNRQTPFRELGIPLDGREKPLIEKCHEWIQRLKPEQEIMPYKRQTAWNHLKRVQITVKTLNKFTRERQEESFGIYPHYLRHCRASHMAIDYNYDYKRMMKFFGWTTPRMVDYYFTSNWAYLARGFDEGTQ